MCDLMNGCCLTPTHQFFIYILADRHFQLGQIILFSSQPELEPTIYRTRCEHAHHSTSAAKTSIVGAVVAMIILHFVLYFFLCNQHLVPLTVCSIPTHFKYLNKYKAGDYKKPTFSMY